MNQPNHLRRAALALAIALPLAAGAQTKEPLRIGAVSSQSGVFAQQGQETLRAIQFAVDEANAKGGIDGHPVTVQIADDEGTPEAGRRVAEKLARDGNRFLIGAIPSSISLAIGQNLDRWDAMYVSVLSKSDKLTGDSCKPRLFRANHSDAMDLAMMGEWLKTQKEQNFAVLAADYVWGRDSAEFFGKTVKAQGKTVGLELFAPVGTKDFSPYIAQLKAAKPQAVWVVLTGRDAIAFAKQAAEFGLGSSVRIIGHAYIFDYLIKATGNTTEGVWGNIGYGPEIDTPMNKNFVAGWQKQFGRTPTENEGQAYNGMQVIFAGVRKADSVKPAEVAAALHGASFDTVYGPAVMRAEDNQLLIPNFVGRVKTVGGELKPAIEQRFDRAVAPPASDKCKQL